MCFLVKIKCLTQGNNLFAQRQSFPSGSSSPVGAHCITALVKRFLIVPP